MSDGLPEGWVSAELRDVATINPRHPRGLDDTTAVSFAPMASLSESAPVFGFLEERPLGEVRKGFTHFADGDVLFAKITPCMENGKGAVASDLRNGLGCGTTEVHVIRPSASLDARFLYRFLAQGSVRRAARDAFTGTAGQARVPTSFIEGLGLPLPPLAEQRRIVAKLEDLLGKVDACQKRLAKVPPLLKRFRQSVLAAACSGRLTADWREQHPEAEDAAELVARVGRERRRRAWEWRGLPRAERRENVGVFDNFTPQLRQDMELPELPATWQWVDLRFLMAPEEPFCYGVVQPGDDDPGGPRLIRVCDMGNGTMQQAGLRGISSAVHSRYQRSILRGGEVLVSVVGTIGRPAMVPPALAGANIARAVAKIPVREFDARYAILWLSTSRAEAWMVGDAREVARMTLNLEQLRTLPAPLPSLPEQHEIVRRVEALFALADRIEARFTKAKAQVDRLTQALLAKAFRGELVPQDPNDEPASVLLERMRASQETRTLARRGKTAAH